MAHLSLFDQVVYAEYMDDLNYSQGFYVTPAGDGSAFVGGIRKVGEHSGDHHREAERAAKFAVEERNKKEGAPLKFLRILNLNVEPSAGAIYYITMAAADASGETRHYQAKVWVKLNSGYQVQEFRLAPYWVKSADKLANNSCCVGVCNLEPWMDESYLYYKCFYRAPKEFLGVEVIYNEQRGESRGLLWFTDCAESKKILSEYAWRRMPHSKIYYDFDFCMS